MAGSAFPPRRLAVIVLLAAPRIAAGAAPAWLDEAVAQANARRAARGHEPLVVSTPLRRAAELETRELAGDAARFLAARPEEITALAELGDLPGRLQAAGFQAHRAKAHVIVSERPLVAADLLDGNPALADDLLDGGFRELGLDVARGGRMEIAVAILALSTADDFARRTRAVTDLAAVRQQLLEQSNRARFAAELRLLRVDQCLERVAQEYADRMLAEGFYGHYGAEGEDVLARVRAAGCRRRRVAENLARGQTTAAEVVGEWLDSPGHRDNLLDPHYRRVGFGLALGLRDGEGWILWVQVLGGD